MSSLFWANGVCAVFVRGHGTQQRVGQNQNFPGDGDEGNFARLAASLQRGIEGFHGVAIADGGDGSLVESDTNFAAATTDVSDAVDGAAVVGKRSQADECGDGLSGSIAELGQVNQEGARNLRADADDGLENFVLGLEGLGVVNDAIHALFEILNLALEEGDSFVDVLEDFRRGALSGMAVVFFGSDEADELATTVAEVAEFEDFLRRQWANDGGDDFAKMGQDASVDDVRLGKLAGALGKVTDLAGIDDDGGQAGGEQGAHGGFLIRAGGLEDDPLGGEGLDPGNKLFNAGGCIGESLADASRSDVCIEEIFANIDADQDAVQGWPS